MAVESQQARLVKQSFVYPLVTAGAVVMLIPLIWTLSTSLKTLDQLNVWPPQWIPNPIAWWNYFEVFQVQPVALSQESQAVENW